MNTNTQATTGKKGGKAAKVTPVVAAPATDASTTATAGATAPVVAAKAPSKTEQGKPIFAAALVVRQQEITDNVPMENRVYKTNKDFRLGVCYKIAADLQVSLASAGSMYNSYKLTAEKDALAAGVDLGLGRDPKKEKPAKKAKVVVATAPATLDTSATDAVQTSQEEAGAQ